MVITEITRLNRFFRILVPAMVFMVAGSCTTKKNTVVTRTYHNVTSHYNIYFNAYDSYNQGLKKAETQFKDDFNTMIPLFTYGSKDAARILLSDMDRTVKKCSKVIGMHSIKAKPKLKKGNRSTKQKDFYRKGEYNKWVDDAYLLMGKAYFNKRDYFPAMEAFGFVLSQFPDDGLSDESNLWLAMTQIELKHYTEAQQILDRLRSVPGISEKFRSRIETVYADLYIRQGDAISALPLLEKAVVDYPSKSERIRISYVIGQIYEKEKDSVNASRWYTRVNEMNPAYDMAFNARINRARLYQGGADAAEGIRKELMKMLRDEKNIDYLDQVYYALAELDMKEGKVDEGIANYKKSIQFNTSNTTQKALSYLALARHYYDKNEFIPAGTYYDSCSQVLPDTYPDYKNLVAFAENVRMLSENLKIAQREDSLQTVAKMSTEEREKLFASRIAEAQKKEEEEKARQEEERMNMQSGRMNGMGSMQGMNNRGMFGQQRMPGSMNSSAAMSGSLSQAASSGGYGNASPGAGSNLGGNSSWYFYNPAAISYGSIEFIKYWGRRKLEDNWRRSNKKVVTEASDMGTEGETGEISTPVANTKTNTFKPTQREFYLNDLPMNDTLMRESNDRIAQAYLNAGKIFKDQLNRPSDALYYFNWLNTRYPDDQRLLFSYYNMYQIYSDQKNVSEMNRYKDLILQKFPDSRSAKIISNPNYFKELDDERAAVVKFYEDTYRDYQGKNYKTVISNCEKADTAFKLNPIRDKFGLLRIMAFARVNPNDTANLVKSINDLVFKYPQSEVADPARNLLNYLQKGPSEMIGKTARKVQVGLGAPATQDNAEDLKYVPEESATHFYVVVVSGSTVDVGKLKFRISNFNVEKYTEDFFEVSSTLLGDDLQVITVKNFTNKKNAMDYYAAITADPTVYEGMKDTDYRHFVITKDNYTRLYKNKDVFGYYQFFRDNYLNQ